MPTDHLVLANEYRDSVSLMAIASRLRSLEGVDDASLVMMTASNLALLADVGLGIEGVEPRPSDLLLIVSGVTDEVVTSALDAGRTALTAQSTGSPGERNEEPSRSIAMAIDRLPEAGLVVISTPGEFAIHEAEKALGLGLHVMLFSDGIDLDEELRLKQLADGRELLVMGPDCGTAIIGGVPLAFANQVTPGPIGVVGASGTGIQAIVSAIDHHGGGVSHALGTGGHDLHERIGGISMLRAIEMLGGDAATEVMVLVSKPPAPAIARRVVSAALATGKPTVVCFLGADPSDIPAGAHVAETLEAAAATAVGLAGGTPADTGPPTRPFTSSPAASQRWVRGLYSGGTLCFEATMVLGRTLDPLASNTPVGRATPPADPWRSEGHTLVDLGDDVFTRGRPHPMIDHTTRNQRMVSEAGDPTTAVVLFDVVLGHGSHDDPAAAMAPAIVEARAVAEAAGRTLPMVAVIVGTKGDPQGLTRQVDEFERLGVHTFRSHGQALEAVAGVLAGVGNARA